MKIFKNFENQFSEELFQSFGEESLGIIIGNFDGVHLGHQALLKSFIKSCEERKISPLLVTFSPHPYLFFHPKASFLIQSKRQKYSKLAECKIENIWEIEFSKTLQEMGPKQFFLEAFGKLKNINLFYLGYDFKLGAGKKDAKSILVESFPHADVLSHEPVFLNEKKLSSTLIRSSLEKGDLSLANKMLGQPYTIKSKVISGRGIGKKKLFPTINTPLEDNLVRLERGVYKTRVFFDQMSYHGVTNIGINPTIAENGPLSVETYILDFEGDLYHKEVEIEFTKKIRNEIKFESIQDLKEQIADDIKVARRLIEN